MFGFLYYLNPIVAAKNIGTSIYGLIYDKDNSIQSKTITRRTTDTISFIKDTSIVTYTGILLFNPAFAGVIHTSLIGYVLTLTKIIGGILLL